MRIVRVLLSVALVILLAGCSALPQIAAKQQSGDCTERFAASQASPDAAVPGSYACFNARIQRGLAATGTSDDAGVQRLAQTAPIFRHYRKLGVTHSGFTAYELWGDGGEDEILVMHLDANGRIDGGGTAMAIAPK